MTKTNKYLLTLAVTRIIDDLKTVKQTVENHIVQEEYVKPNVNKLVFASGTLFDGAASFALCVRDFTYKDVEYEFNGTTLHVGKMDTATSIYHQFRINQQFRIINANETITM